MSKNTSTTFVYLSIALLSIFYISGRINQISFSGQTANISDSLNQALATEIPVDYSASDRGASSASNTDLSIAEITESISNNNVDFEIDEIETDPNLGASEYVVVDVGKEESISAEPVEVAPEETTIEEFQNQEPPVPDSINIHTFEIASEDTVDMFLAKRQKIRTFNLGGNVYIFFLTLVPSKITLNITNAEGEINNVYENKQIFGADSYSLSHFIKINNEYLSPTGSNKINIKAITANNNMYTQVIFFDHSTY